MRQKLVNRAYLIALLMSIIIYSLGVGTGIYVQRTTTAKTEKLLEDLQSRVESAQLEYVYISTLGDSVNCDALSVLVDETTGEVRIIGKELTELESKGETGQKFSNLKKQYAILSTRGWILNSYVQDRCSKNATTVLYFYSVPCSECEQQGYILDGMVSGEFKNQLIIFVLDVNVDEPIVTTLKKTYNVKTTPALVVGNQTYLGLQTSDELRDIIIEELSR